MAWVQLHTLDKGALDGQSWGDHFFLGVKEAARGAVALDQSWTNGCFQNWHTEEGTFG